MSEPIWDHVIVEAGTVGASLAARLNEDIRRHVLLLEAVGSERTFWITTPMMDVDRWAHPLCPALEGLWLVRCTAWMPALDRIIDEELMPGPEATSDEVLADCVPDKTWTLFHTCCTCHMGTDPATSVNGPGLRVHGIGGLRIADASAFPTIPSGNTNAPVIMVGERAADIIRSGT